jgi:N6-L-threonylcarbamoyladenine synthase
MRLLAIETSCDEMAAAVFVEGKLASSIIATQEIHRLYGGVVPELASRAHVRSIVPIVETAVRDAGITTGEIDALAVTQGPGLIGSLLVGVSFVKAFAAANQLPFVGVNHLEGHLFSNNINEDGPELPFVSLIVSGGHTILVHLQEWGKYEILGQTQDDAAGEAFDKVAKILGLPYPGGPALEALARQSDAGSAQSEAPHFPVARLTDPFAFSFSGLKTAVLYHVRTLTPERLSAQRPRIAAAFQNALIAALVEKTAAALAARPAKALALAGGVACNEALRLAMAKVAAEHEVPLFFPKPVFCTDNAAMIGRAGMFYLQGGKRDALSLSPQPGLALSSTI